MILHGDCLEKLKEIEDNSIDSVVTDPPYGLAFMGKKWDYDVPSIEIWKEVLRVLKPGGHLLSFGGTRTYHRMAVNIEDAGFEIRDQVQWIYGSGFPKSLDVSKAIDKAAGAERKIVGSKDVGPDIRGNNFKNDSGKRMISNITEPKTEAAKQWQGWGTALKPANEPICLARKPLEKGLTVAENVLKWGVGALNIDGSRIETDEKLGRPQAQKQNSEINLGLKNNGFNNSSDRLGGRWPANLLLDEEAAALLDEPSRFFYVAKASGSERNAGLEGLPKKQNEDWPQNLDGNDKRGAQPRENFHPTVKPLKLMEYLIKLITPQGGTVLDPFMGSGTTGIAARDLGHEFIGIERDAEYFKIAKARIKVSEPKNLAFEGAV